MSITYSWKITGIKKVDTKDVQGVIFQTYWKKIGEDTEGNIGEFVGATPFDPKTVDPENFISFENLTEELVLGWIQNIVVGDYERHVNERIAEQIEAKKVNIEEVNDGALPWQPGDTPVTPAPTSVAE
jgi:hypothetical protein